MKKLILITIVFLSLFCGAQAQVIVTAAGNGIAGYSGDGLLAVDAELRLPQGVVLDDSGNLYICDVNNGCIRKVSPGYGGIITTIAGTGTPGYNGNHALGIYTQLNGAYDVAIDHNGNVYIPDAGNNCIWKVNPADSIFMIAGTSIAGYNGDGIPATAAQVNSPIGIAVDIIGNVFFIDAYNYRIRRIDTNGIITTIAGTGVAGFSPDGSQADTVKLDLIGSIRIDKSGNLFFTDNVRVRKIDSAGIITTIAGNGIIGYSGDSGMATSAEIGGSAIAIDSAGDIFIADGSSSNRVRMVNTAGFIYTIAGNGIGGYSGDNIDPLLAHICAPTGVAVNNMGEIYIGDMCNNRVRLVTMHPLDANKRITTPDDVTIFPNPCDQYFNIQVNQAIDEMAEVSVSNIVGEIVSKLQMKTNKPVTVPANWPPGVYIINATTKLRQYNVKVFVR